MPECSKVSLGLVGICDNGLMETAPADAVHLCHWTM
jgi:hypothetical protein